MTENIGIRLLESIARQAESAGSYCIAEGMTGNQRVHELRRAFKRLRALLGFFGEIPESMAFHLREDIGNFAGLLAPLRESAVNSDLFGREIADHKLLPEDKIMGTRKALIERNRLLLEHWFREHNLGTTMVAFFEDFDKILLLNNKGLPTVEQVYREVIRSYNNSYSLFRRLPGNPHPEELHELRKKLKKLWYQLEFIHFLQPRYLELKCNQLDIITDQLGEDHDLHVFTEEFLDSGYGLEQEELDIVANQAEKTRLLNQQKLLLRLRQFFGAPPGEFNQKMERFFLISNV